MLCEYMLCVCVYVCVCILYVCVCMCVCIYVYVWCVLFPLQAIYGNCVIDGMEVCMFGCSISRGMLSLFMAFCSGLDEQICYWSSYPNVHPCH